MRTSWLKAAMAAVVLAASSLGSDAAAAWTPAASPTSPATISVTSPTLIRDALRESGTAGMVRVDRDSTVVVNGTIQDVNGDPVTGEIEMQVSPCCSPVRVQTTTADAAGRFEFELTASSDALITLSSASARTAFSMDVIRLGSVVTSWTPQNPLPGQSVTVRSSIGPDGAGRTIRTVGRQGGTIVYPAFDAVADEDGAVARTVTAGRSAEWRVMLDPSPASDGSPYFPVSVMPVTSPVSMQASALPPTVRIGESAPINIAVHDDGRAAPASSARVAVVCESATGRTESFRGTTDSAGQATVVFRPTRSASCRAAVLDTPTLKDYAPTEGNAADVAVTRAVEVDSSLNVQPCYRLCDYLGKVRDEKGAPLSGRQAELWRAIGWAWVKVGTATSAADGTVSFPGAVTTTARYQVRIQATTVAEVQESAASSPATQVMITPTFSLNPFPARVKVGGSLVVSGTLRGGFQPEPVVLRVNGQIFTGTTDASGRFTFSVRPGVAGNGVFVAHPATHYLAASQQWVSVSVVR